MWRSRPGCGFARRPAACTRSTGRDAPGTRRRGRRRHSRVQGLKSRRLAAVGSLHEPERQLLKALLALFASYRLLVVLGRPLHGPRRLLFVLGRLLRGPCRLLFVLGRLLHGPRRLLLCSVGRCTDHVGCCLCSVGCCTDHVGCCLCSAGRGRARAAAAEALAACAFTQGAAAGRFAGRLSHLGMRFGGEAMGGDAFRLPSSAAGRALTARPTAALPAAESCSRRGEVAELSGAPLHPPLYLGGYQVHEGVHGPAATLRRFHAGALPLPIGARR